MSFNEALFCSVYAAVKCHVIVKYNTKNFINAIRLATHRHDNAKTENEQSKTTKPAYATHSHSTSQYREAQYVCAVFAGTTVCAIALYGVWNIMCELKIDWLCVIVGLRESTRDLNRKTACYDFVFAYARARHQKTQQVFESQRQKKWQLMKCIVHRQFTESEMKIRFGLYRKNVPKTLLVFMNFIVAHNPPENRTKRAHHAAHSECLILFAANFLRTSQNVWIGALLK